MRVGKSITARGATVQEALEKAASLLCVPISSLAYDILEGGAGARAPFKIRAVCVAPPPDDHDDDPLAVLDHISPPWSEDEVAALTPQEFLTELRGAKLPPVRPAPEEPAAAAEPETFREIPHDIGMAFGSFDHNGDLVIRGSVTYGVTIRTTGAVSIDGDIDGAFVDCATHLNVKGGILGTARSRHGGVSCHYAHAAYIVAGQRIAVKESVVHSRLIARVEIEVGNAIVGGSAYAHNILWARSAGSDAGVPTTLIAGRNRALRGQLDDIRNHAARIAEHLRKCEGTIEQLMPAAEDEVHLFPGERIALWQAVAEKAVLAGLALELADKRAQLIAQIDRDKTARIKVRDRAFPHTTIEIDDGGTEIRSITHYATFSKDYETGAIRTTPYS